MYPIAACLPRLRPLLNRLQITFSLIFSSLLVRRCGSSDDGSPDLDSSCRACRELAAERGCKAPRIDIKLTGQGNLDSLAVRENDWKSVT